MLNLSFLSPLFFIGLAALALPIIAHLISRKSGVKKSFPAVTFLISSQGDLATRSRIKDLILLLLRALILVLLVLVFAKPAMFSFSKSADNSTKSIAIVIDNTFSMGYEGNFDRALERAQDLIDSIPDGSFTIVAPLVPNNEDEQAIVQERNRLKRAIKKIELSNTFTNNETRLQGIYSKLQKTPNDKKEVALITDFQRNGWKNKEYEVPWLELIDISQDLETSNHAVSEIDLDHEDDSIRIQAQISNFSNDSVPELLTKINLNQEEIREYIAIEPNNSSSLEVSFNNSNALDGVGKVQTTADKLKVDDIRHFITDGKNEDTKILIVDGDPREDSRLSETYYLARALETISEISGTQITVLDNDGLLNRELSEYDVIYLANVGEITPRIAKELEEFVDTGGTAVIFLGNSVRANFYNTLLKNILPGEIQSIIQGKLLLSHVNSEVFSKEIADKISQISIEKIFKTAPYPGSEVIINTITEDPFLIKKDYGGGSVFIFTSTADTKWNNFSITPVFLPVIKKIHDLPNTERSNSRNYFVGETVKIETFQNAKSMVVTNPVGKKHNVDNDLYEFKQTNLPGIYAVEVDGEVKYRFAVNINPEESNLKKISPRSIKSGADEEGGLAKVFKEIWRYFLWGVIALFVSESAFRAIFSK